MIKRSESRVFHDARDWLVQVVRKGDRYGYQDCKVHEGADADTFGDMVEFWDLDNVEVMGPRGQFVSRYYIFTFMKHVNKLKLHGGIPVWQIHADTVKAVQAWLVAEVIR